MILEREQLVRLGLSPGEIDLFSNLESTLQYHADLIGADMFLGYFLSGEAASVVIAEATPQYSLSNYKAPVLGQKAFPENEPAVFAAQDLQLPVWDTMAITQEQKTVRQDVVPLKNSAGRVVGTLICERDISSELRQQQKYSELVQMLQSAQEQRQAGPRDLFVERQEIHHRVKNNLQMVASILNIQARRCNAQDARAIFKENVSRILSIADIYDILAHNDNADQVSLRNVVERIRQHILIGGLDTSQAISIKITGDEIMAPSEQATLVAVVVNELITNAVEHAFPGRDHGTISIVLRRGNRRSQIMVEDDGVGFDTENYHGGNGNIGLELVHATVEERLKGSLHVSSSSSGSKFSFDFLTE